jgi:hypothetical protein
LGVASYIGRLNAASDEVHYTPISGIQPNPGPLVAPAVAGGGRYVVCEVPGIMPDGSWLGGTSFTYGDYAMSDGDAWYHLPFRSEQVTGSMVALTPPVLGANNVQTALQTTETRLANALEKTGGTISGMLTVDVGVPGLPSLFVRQPPGTAAALYIQGHPTGTAAAIEGDVSLATGNLSLTVGSINAMAGFIQSRQFFVGVDFNCGYLLGPDSNSGGLWRNATGQMTLRRPPGQNDIYSESSDVINRSRILTELDRAAPLLVNIPFDLPIAGGGAWVPLVSQTYPIPRGGTSLVKVTLSLNLSTMNPGQLFAVGARVTGNPERRSFIYCFTLNLTSGVSVDLYATVTGFNPPLPIELCSYMDGSLQGNPFTVLGTAEASRSQIMITDLGPPR